MRIGIEAQRLLRKNKYGIDIVALNLLRNITAADPKNEYVLFTRNGDDATCLSTLKNIRVVILPALTYADWEQIMLPLAVKREKIDILHCTSSTAPIFVSVPVILTVHDVICFERPLFGERGQSFYQRMGNAYRTIVSKIAMDKASMVITVSHAERERMAERFPFLNSKISVIHNGVDTVLFRSSTERTVLDIRNRYTLPKIYFLHFGSTDPKKNTELVLRSFVSYALSAEKIFPLVITGVSPMTVKMILKSCSAEHLSAFIHTPGYIAHEHLSAVYASALAFLFPSNRESFGLPLIEAMAAGVPVITLKNACTTEIVGDAALFLRLENSTEIASTMSFVQTNIQKIITLVQLGSERADSFSWKHCAELYAHKYLSYRHIITAPVIHSFNYTIQPIIHNHIKEQ
jgi:glycosyltransferase involved in cell wall biosynthesis